MDSSLFAVYSVPCRTFSLPATKNTLLGMSSGEKTPSYLFTIYVCTVQYCMTYPVVQYFPSDGIKSSDVNLRNRDDV